MKFCPQCGAKLPPNARFCVECGTKIPTGTSSSPPKNVSGGHVTLGDVGVLRGNIDASTHVFTHIDSQTNIGGDVNYHIIQETRKINPEELRAQGRKLLEAGLYADAIKILKKAVQSDAGNGTGNLLLAIALLQGRYADTHTRWTIREVEANLQSALSSVESRKLALYVLGVVKYDYYVANGQNEGHPTVKEIRNQLKNTSLSWREKILLRHVVASPEAKRFFQKKW